MEKIKFWPLQSAFENEKTIFFAIQKMMANSHQFSDPVFIEFATTPEVIEKFAQFDSRQICETPICCLQNLADHLILDDVIKMHLLSNMP